MESLTENKALLYSVMGSSAAILALALGIFPEIAYQFEIVEFPGWVSYFLTYLIFFTNSFTRLSRYLVM